MGEHSWALLRRYEKCVAGMIADPDCGGDLLLLGIGLARATILRDPPPDESGSWKFSGQAAMLFGSRYTDKRRAMWKITDILRRDVPRYDQFYEDDSEVRRCGAPMIRRAGECGQHATGWDYVTDLKTGRKHSVGRCARHKQWFAATTRANREAVKAAGSSLPQPPQNAGGVLARHVSGIGWTKVYRYFNNDWVQPPQGEESFVPPKLRLLKFEMASGDAS